MKADLIRYLLLFAHGGAWTDHDVSPVRPLSSCPFPSGPDQATSNHTSLITGIEIDEPFVTPATRKQWHWSRVYGLIQYHMVAKPFSPFLRKAIVRVVAHAYAHGKKRNSGLQRIWGWWFTKGGLWTGNYAETEVLEITGPGMWTDAILDTLTDAASKTIDGGVDVGLVKKKGDWVTWEAFTRIQEPREVILPLRDNHEQNHDGEIGQQAVGLYVLPINYWGNGQRHSGAKNFRAEAACINHLFLRSWKRGWWEWAFG